MEGKGTSTGGTEVAVDRRKVVGLFDIQGSRPRISVVIPTYNHAPSLARLLAALRHSSVPPGGMEVIVVDDGSTDATEQVVADADVTRIWQKNAGTAAARDRGWRASRGQVIVFFDDDTVPEPDVVTLLDHALLNADGAGAHFVALCKKSLIADYTHADGLIDHRVVHGEVRWLITGAAAFRRSALERVDGFDLGFLAAGEDVDLSIRMLRAGCSLTVERAAVVHHAHRARFGQLLETCYRYGTFSRELARRHDLYRGERTAASARRINPVDWVRLYRGFRLEASRRRSIAFLGLHLLVLLPYALGLARSRFSAQPLAAPSWRQLPAASTVELNGASNGRAASDAVITGARQRAAASERQSEASAV